MPPKWLYTLTLTSIVILGVCFASTIACCIYSQSIRKSLKLESVIEIQPIESTSIYFVENSNYYCFNTNKDTLRINKSTCNINYTVMCILAGLIYSKSSNINPALLEKGKKATYKEFIEQAISPLNDKGGLYIEEYLAVKKPKILSVDIYISTDSVTGNKSKALNVVYVDNNTVTSKIDSRSIVFSVIRSAIIPIDILTDYEKISEPELYYESGFNLLLPHNQLREYYRVNTEDFKALVDSFKLS